MSADKQLLCIILGGGGHAQVLIDSIRLSGAATPYAILDTDPSRWGQAVLGVTIVGSDEKLAELISEGVNCFTVGLGGIGDNRPRRRLYEFGYSFDLKPLTVIHPRAIYSHEAKIGAGAQIFPGVIVNAGAKLGVNVIVNSGAIVEHDCILGDHVHVATGARLCSTVQVSAGAHIGAGATVKQGLTIGAGAIVGAGAVVVKDVPPQTIVVGVPASFLREV